MPNETERSTIVIRDIEGVSALRAVEALQKDVWGCADLDVVPLTMFVAGREVGATIVGAYDRSLLVGFVYGFPAYEQSRLTHHSHMLAVRPSYRNHNLAYKLKLAQRERVLAQGIKRITWTFDPLQSLNAHFNFGKLGVIAGTYKINFYGEATSSFLHQIGTDRLWVEWLLDRRRVRERLESQRSETSLKLENLQPLVKVGVDQTPQKNTSPNLLKEHQLLIEIPAHINELQNESPKLAIEWRAATRLAFTDAIAAGYIVEDFYHSSGTNQSVGSYVLSRRKKVEDFE